MKMKRLWCVETREGSEWSGGGGRAWGAWGGCCDAVMEVEISVEIWRWRLLSSNNAR